MKELVGHRVLLPSLERNAAKVAIHDGCYHATYGEHLDRVLRLSSGLRHQIGLSEGGRFAVLAGNGHETLELYHAAFLGAGVINPLNLRLSGPELVSVLGDSQTEVVFVDTLFADHLLGAIGRSRESLALREVVLIGDGDQACERRYEELVADAEPKLAAEPEETDPVVIMYTGGTTGSPKGVVLDQRAEMLNLYHIAMTVDLDPERVYLHQTPMFHAASMGGLLGIPAIGGTSVFLKMFEPYAALSLIEQYEVDWTVMVPTMIAMLLAHPKFEAAKLSSLRDLVYGASPMPSGLLAQLTSELPSVGLWQGYGMTECSSVLTMLDAKDHRAGGARLSSAGRPVIGVTISVVDPSGRPVAQGEQGEVCARGGNFMQRYLNDDEATSAVFRDGWYHTGDAGYLDEGGYLFLVDRVNDMIVTGGENVYSIEVENAISSHEGVADVAVIGVPDPTWGEQVHAIVVLRPGATVTEEEIKEHARSKIARYKVPKSVELTTEPLPQSGAMKPLKRELRRRYLEARDLERAEVEDPPPG